jgi:hypothetical protein
MLRFAAQTLAIPLYVGILITSPLGLSESEFIAADAGCARIMSLRNQWQKLEPVLPDPPKLALFDNGTGVEWKHLYLPKADLTESELKSTTWDDLLATGLVPHGDGFEPGLLLKNRSWIEFLKSCPNTISSNRNLGSGAPDWVAPHFFELYELPLAQKQYRVISTRFTDRSAFFAGEYVALYLGDYCPAEKIFVSQGPNQQVEFLQYNGQLVMTVKIPEKKLVRYMTFVPQSVDNSYFVEVCRGILKD